MARVPIHEQDDRSLDLVPGQMVIKILENLQEHFPCDVAILGHGTLPLAGHTIAGNVSEMAITVPFAGINKADADIVAISSNSEGRTDMEFGITAFVVDWAFIPSRSKNLLMLHS